MYLLCCFKRRSQSRIHISNIDSCACDWKFDQPSNSRAKDIYLGFLAHTRALPFNDPFKRPPYHTVVPMRTPAPTYHTVVPMRTRVEKNRSSVSLCVSQMATGMVFLFDSYPTLSSEFDGLGLWSKDTSSLYVVCSIQFHDRGGPSWQLGPKKLTPQCRARCLDEHN